jgi:hypothetical protein
MRGGRLHRFCLLMSATEVVSAGARIAMTHNTDATAINNRTEKSNYYAASF